jgi:hypothetical protein
MFADRLRDYTFRDSERRTRDNRLSITIAIIASFVMLIVGKPERVAAMAGLVVLFASMFSLTIYSCSHAARVAAKRPRTASGKDTFLCRPVSRRVAAFSLVIFLVAVTIPQIAAAALERKLRRLTSKLPLDENSIDELTQTVHTAAALGLKLPSTSRVLPALRDASEVNSRLSAAAIDAASAVASASTLNLALPPEMQGKMFSSLPGAKGSTWGFNAIATNTGADNYSWIGIAAAPDFARMERIGTPGYGYSGYGPAFFVVKGLTAYLDGYYLRNVIFQDMHLIYNGGPLILENVYFVRCQFQFGPDERSWNLLLAISKGGWVSSSTQGK